MIKYGFILFAFLMVSPVFATSEKPSPQVTLQSCADTLVYDWREHLDEIELQLKAAPEQKIKVIMPMHDYLISQGKKAQGIHPVFLIEFEDGLKAVWKPEDKLWKAHGEVAAYRAAKDLLGLRLVPPVVITKIGDQLGSLAYFVATKFDVPSASKTELDEALAKVPQKEKSDADLFQFLFGQCDRNLGNFLIDDNNHLVLIDNAALTMLVQSTIGRISYASRAILKPELRSNDDEYYNTPFPYDRVRYLHITDPTVLKGFIRNTDFTQEKLKFELAKLNNDMLPIVFWQNRFWTTTRGNHAFLPNELGILSSSTLQRMRDIYFERLFEVFQPPFSPLHRKLIMERRDQILKHSRTAYLID